MKKERIIKALSSRTADRIARAVIWLGVVVIGLVVLHYGRRILVCDHVIARGPSMTPTLVSGQSMWVRKYLMGPRIFTRFNFEEGEPLHCFRLPGLRRLRAGDIAVFNGPDGWEHFDTVTFQINNVYAKRCLGAAGDTVGARNAHYYSSGADPTGIPLEREAELRAMSDAETADLCGYEAGYFAREHRNWTIRDFGPLVVPARGMTVRLDSIGVQHYAKAICYETGFRPEWTRGQAWLEGRQVKEYTFRKNWCFFVGDNVLDSRDSRYLGFVPEEFVMGII